jgi:hypothetical protein
MTKSFRSSDFHFAPTTMSVALGHAGFSHRPVVFRREPKVTKVYANGIREVVTGLDA